MRVPPETNQCLFAECGGAAACRVVLATVQLACVLWIAATNCRKFGATGPSFDGPPVRHVSPFP
jgi:hypothetical protein